MLNSVQTSILKIKKTLQFAYRMLRGINYQALCLYVLRINQHREIDAIIHEVSRCLKEILDYELFGFVLKNGSITDVWIDPQIYTDQFTKFLVEDCKCQKNDLSLHQLQKKSPVQCQKVDAIDLKRLISYNVIEINFVAKIYLLPKRKMRSHYETIITTIIRSLGTALEKNLNTQKLENAASIDQLTNCYNRRALFDFIVGDIAYAQRNGCDLSVVMIDADNFKEINDMYGHPVGDAVLKEIATLITSHVRKSDYLARYGGEEFVLVLPDTPLYNAAQLAEKLRKMIELHGVTAGKKRIKITASFGVASLENKSGHAELFREADERLYMAKASGKNCVIPGLLPSFADRTFAPKKRVRKYVATAQMR